MREGEGLSEMASGDGKKGNSFGIYTKYNLQDPLMDWMWMMKGRIKDYSEVWA